MVLRRVILSFAAVMNLLLLDQIVKAAAVFYLKGQSPIEVLGVFNLAYVENRGAAWGMFQGNVWPLAAFACLAMGVLIWKRKSFFPEGWTGVVAELMLYAGILGNLVDRVARGCVVDMFDFHWGPHHFPCFNVADAYITVAAGLMLLMGWFQGKRNEGGGRHDSA